MKVGGVAFRSIRLADDGWAVEIVDQTRLPHDFVIRRLESLPDAAEAIQAMRVRGAPLIGATAAYGLALAMRGDPSGDGLNRAASTLLATRPTAVNLGWAVADLTAFATCVAAGDGMKRNISRACSTFMPLTRSRIGLTLPTGVPVLVIVALTATLTCLTPEIRNVSYAFDCYAGLEIRSEREECPRNVRVGANSPNLWPTIFSAMNTGTCRRPS